MTQLLSFKPKDKERLDSWALESFNDWQHRILSKASQLRQFSIEQIRAKLDTYLHDNERAGFSKCVADKTK